MSPRSAHARPAPSSYAGRLAALLGGARQPLPDADGSGLCRTLNHRVCTLCHASHWTYEEEVAAKNEAFRAYWRDAIGDPTPSPLVVAEGRFYRAVSKRRAFEAPWGIQLGLIEPGQRGSDRAVEVRRCAIEPDTHRAVYDAVREALTARGMRGLAEELRYVVVKSGGGDTAVIFSVGEISHHVVRAAGRMSRSLTDVVPAVTGVFLFEESGRANYYLSTSGRGRPVFRTVFGAPRLRMYVGERSFSFHPLAFTQAHPVVMAPMLARAADMLAGDGTTDLYDLYSGYGLFTLGLAPHFRRVTGMELSAEAVSSAIANARAQGVANARFRGGDVTADGVFALLGRARPGFRVLLDPPRGGTAEGVIECIAAMRPARVAHLFCNVDILPSEIGRWRAGGYDLAAAVPFDNFPGTDSLEILCLFTPAGTPDGHAPART